MKELFCLVLFGFAYISANADSSYYLTYEFGNHTWYYNAYSGIATVGALHNWKDSRGHSYTTYYPAVDENTYGRISIPTILPDNEGKDCVVTRICDGAFYQLKRLTCVEIASTVTSIGEIAFSESGIMEVEIPYGVTSVGKYAFQRCEKLRSVSVPAGITSMGERAFGYCTNLTSVTFADGVTSIANSMFVGCTALSNVSLPGSVSYICPSAFCDCACLTSLALTNGLIGIGCAAFKWCGNLKSVSIPPSVTFIEDSAFADCSGLETLILKGGLTGVGSCAFMGCDKLDFVSIPASVLTIGESAFANCSGLTTLTLEEGLENIGDYAFKGCCNLKSVKIPTSVKSIGAHAFEGCCSLSAISVPDGVTSIGSGAFQNCTNLKSVAMPSTVINAGGAIFTGCERLENATLPPNIQISDCKNVSQIVIPGGVLSIGAHAYDGCEGLRYVVIPETVTMIGDAAFCGCGNLLSVVMLGDAPDLGVDVFIGTPKKLIVYVPDGSVGWDGGVSAVLPETWGGRTIVHSRGAYSTVTLNVCGGSAAWKKEDVVSGTAVGTLPKATREGYEFLGWFTAAVGGTQVTADTVVTEDVTFYAHWKLVGPQIAIPGEKVEIDTGFVGYTASGLPTGLAYNRTTGMITGAATKPGEYAVKFTKSGAETEEMTIVVTAVPKVTVEMVGVNAQSDTNGCKVTGAGEYLVGKTVTLKAAVPVGTMFEGWFDGEDAVATQATYSFTMGKEDVALVAKFKKERMSVACTWLSDGVFTAGVAAGAGDGILLDDYVTTESGIKSIAVAKLPSGMTYNATKRTIAGFPNKAGTYNVEITVTAKSGAVEKQTIPLTVEALPAWAVGNFAGWTDCADGTHGTASLSVTAAGKVSGKFLEHGSNWTFTATSYDVASVTRGENQAYLINAEAVCGKAKRTVGLQVRGLGLATGDLGGGETVEMWRNVWAEAEPKAHLATIAGKYTYFLTDGKSEPVALPLSLNSSSALLSGSVKIPWQANRSVTFSTTAFASSNGVEAVFYVAPDAKKGYPEFFERFTLVPESGEREAGKAHRNPGVLASAVAHEKGGNGSVSVSPAGGQVDAGKTVTLTATAKADSVFVRWEGTQGSRRFVDPNAKLVLTMDGEHDVVAEAVFRLRTSFDTPEVVVDSAAEYALSRISVGVPVSIRPVVRDEENMLPVKWSAQNLPSGLRIDATTGEITGVATAINSKPIIIIATSVADSKKVGKAELAADVKPEALPAWAVGDFVGTVRCADGTHGTASFTVSAAGKVTNGKLLEHGSNWTFTAASYAASSVTRGAEREYVVVSDATCNKAKRTVELHVRGWAAREDTGSTDWSAENAALAAGLFGDDEVELWRNVWRDADAKGVVAGIAGKYTYFLGDGTALPLNLTSAGVLSGKVNVPARGNASVSFSTTVFASSNGVEAAFYVAPDAKKGYGEIYERFVLVPESGAREAGKAHRAPGVVAVPESYVSPEGKTDTGMGTATVSPAGGQVDAGKTVTVSATADAKSVFVKWRYAKNGETNFCETAKMTFTMDGEHDVKAWAIFRSKESFAAPVVAVETSEQAKFGALELGVQFSAFVTVEDVENMKPVKWSAANLPSGLKINAETGEISGVATAVNTKPVTITATSVADSRKKTTFTLDIGAQDGKPAALPETAVGTFTGFVNNGTDNLGTFTFTSSEKGALSAKVVDAAGTVSFSGSGFAWSKDGKYGVALKTTKDETLTLTLDSGAGWDKDQLTGTYKTATGLLRNVTSQRNAFSKAWYFAAEGDETNGWTFAFTTDVKAAALTVTLKADGTTSIAGKLPNGVDKNGKALTLSVSASGVANAGMMREGALEADFAPVLTVNKVKKVLAIRTNLWFDRKNDHASGIGEAKFVE